MLPEMKQSPKPKFGCGLFTLFGAAWLVALGVAECFLIAGFK